MDFLADILTCQFAELDLQTIQLQQYVSRMSLLFLILIDQLKQQPCVFDILVLNSLFQQHEIRLDLDLRVQQPDELQQILLDVPVIVGPENGDDGFDGVFGVFLLLVQLRYALDGRPETVQLVIFAVDLEQLTEDLHLVILEVILLGSGVELFQLLHRLLPPSLPDQPLNLKILQLHPSLHVLLLLRLLLTQYLPLKQELNIYRRVITFNRIEFQFQFKLVSLNEQVLKHDDR